MSTMFGQSNPGGSGPFGNSQASASASQPTTQASNILSNLNTSQAPQQQGSLFTEGGQSKRQASGGLFSNLGTSQPQSISSLGAKGIFGDTTNSNTQAGLSGSNNATKTSQQLAGSNFNGGLLGPSQAAQSQSNPQHNGQGVDNALHSGYFNSLLEKGRKRSRGLEETSGVGQIPSLQLGLGDIARRLKELGSTRNQTQKGQGDDTKAHYLLAASGVNPGNTLRDLNSLNAQITTPAVRLPITDWDPDTNRYIEQLQQRSTLKMIAEGIDRANRDFDAYLEEQVDINWDAQRKRIYEHFGLKPKAPDGQFEDLSNGNPREDNRGSFGRFSKRGRITNVERQSQGTPRRSLFGQSGMQKSVIGTPGVGLGNATLFADVADNSATGPGAQDDRGLRQRQGKYAEKVQRLNRARLQETVYPILQEFASVEGQSANESPSQLTDAYKALMQIVGENPDAGSVTDPNAVRERQYATDYLDESNNSARTINIRKRIIEGSRKSLEKLFIEQLESLIARNPREANLGGIPTTINKIRAYIRIRSARKDLAPDGTELQLLNDEYCWAIIFFLLRTGNVKEAAEYVTSNATAFRALDRNFVTYITSYASSFERRLPRSQQDRINAEYQQRTRIAPDNSIDPYRLACYKVIGRCELSKRNIEIITHGVEDWMWLQFNLAREVNRVEEVAGEVFGLEEVRETIKEIGQRHFSKGSESAGGYGTYFFMLILGGMFEQAVAFLYPHSYVAAVHFAVALNFYGLLRVSDFSVSESELLTYNTKELPQISFGRMLGYYTRDFRTGNVVAAVDYLTLICLNTDLTGDLGRSQSSLCHEALRELVLETREFAELLGDIRGDGTRITGAIEQRLKLIGLADQEEFLRTVTLQAASVADDSGRTTDAVLLYHLAEDYDSVIVIINRALSDSIAVDIGNEQLRLQPLKPRIAPQSGQQFQQLQSDGSSLSLTSVDDPTTLARNMISLYNANALYYQKIRPPHRDACGVLLRISEAKVKVEAQRWAEALDIITSLSLLPLTANSSIPLIRSHAQTLSTLPPSISRLIGPLLLWTITCIGKQRDLLLSNEGQGGFESDTRRRMRDDLVGKAKDLMVFAGLVKLRLGTGVWEGLVGGAGDLGVY